LSKLRREKLLFFIAFSSADKEQSLTSQFVRQYAGKEYRHYRREDWDLRW